jgi:hypothetical protein
MGGLGDTIQGLRGVIQPSLPSTKTLVMLVVGFVIGLLWAYVLSPTVYYDSDPSSLQQRFQDEWVKLLADRQAATNANVSDHIATMLTYVDNPLEIVNRLIADPNEADNVAELTAIRPAAEQAQTAAATAPEPNLIGNILPFILGPILIVVLGAILSVVWNLLIYPFLEPTINRLGLGKRGGAGATVSDERAAADIQAMRDVKQAMKTQAVDYSATMGKPVIQKMSIYKRGFGTYDDSFSIEDENDRFLGECGAGISETIGAGADSKVTALEVWLFDKDDFVRTMTKVMASPHAFNDPAIRAKLENKGELVMVEPGVIGVLETAALRLQARVVDVEYVNDPTLPEKGAFEKITVEIAVWQKQGGGAPSAGGQRPQLEPAAPVPMPSPVGQQPYSSSSATTPMPPVNPPSTGAYAPPPSAPPRRQDDDPFGGTGDFTPIS